MDKQELLKYCHYYKGEEHFPEELFDVHTTVFLFWEAEMAFVKSSGTQKELEVRDTYLRAGLASANYDLPLSLLAWLFALYLKGNDNPDLGLCGVYFVKNFLASYIDSISK